MIAVMTKAKISATVTPERLARAHEVSGTSNLSQLLDQALGALIERELEQRWLDAHPAEFEVDLPGEVQVDLSAVPWDDE